MMFGTNSCKFPTKCAIKMKIVITYGIYFIFCSVRLVVYFVVFGVIRSDRVLFFVDHTRLKLFLAFL